MKSFEMFWAEHWDSDGEISDSDFLGATESEKNVIELLDTLEDVEKVTSASNFLSMRPPHPVRDKYHLEGRRDYIFDAYAFNSSSYDLTVQCLENGRTPTEQELRSADPLFPEKKRYSKKFFEGVVGRWRKFCSSLEVIKVDRGDGMQRKALHVRWDRTNRIIAHRDEWLAIVDSHHVDRMTLKCLNLRATIQNISRNYITGSRRHGIPEEYIRARIAECSQCNEKCESNLLTDEAAYPSKRLRSTLPDRWPEVHTIPWQQDPLRCNNMGEANARNVPAVSMSNDDIHEPPSKFSPCMDSSAMQFPKIIKLGPSNRNILPHARSDSNAEQPLSNVFDYRSNGHAQQVLFEQRNNLSSCGGVDEYPAQESSFIINPEHFLPYSHGTHSLDDSDRQNVVHSESSVLVTILVHRAHRGHDPFSKDDYIHFPVHSSAREAAIFELDLTSDLAAVSRASLRMDDFLKSRASDLEKATSRFFLTPKDIALLTVEFSSQGKILSTDWVKLLKEVEALRRTGTVIYFQQYDVFNPKEEKQPFVCVLMTSWMREMAMRFSADNVWALDSTFKACVRGLPLYAAAVPNQDGVGMPIFFMLCSADSGSRHESIAIRLALIAVFQQISVRPAAILINKSRTKYDALNEVISRDEKCWRAGKQVACRVLLCWFCTKKAWVENLLPQIPAANRKDVYLRLHNMIMAATESEFFALWTKFKEEYGKEEEIMNYLMFGWIGSACAWHGTWPMFGRLFDHGDMETISIVRQFWQFIRYSLFGGKINRSNYELLLALVGSASTGTRPGGTLEEFFRQKQILCDSRRYHNQASTSAERKRLAAADRYLVQYHENNTIFEVLSEPGFLFRLKNWGNDLSKAHTVNLLTNFCDCLDMMFTCEHLLAARLLVKHNFLEIYNLLERRNKEGDEPMTQVEDIDFAFLEDRDCQTESACEAEDCEMIGASNEWVSLVQEISQVQSQLTNLQSACDSRLLGLPIVEELTSFLNIQLKSLRFFTGVEQILAKGPQWSRMGIIKEHVKACQLRVVKFSHQSAAGAPSANSGPAKLAPTAPMFHPKVGFVQYYRHLKPPKVDKERCKLCGVYNVIGGVFDRTECKNCNRYLKMEAISS
ncbi:hypothetical protein O6H91_02G080200 [Diphasiastrum complanatum]|uniref:Uncharacterized protein n=1 Tax=Diphasiastrum complanatum TaxID=34168 RepID=A0ACC2EH59_DIPCM|nr:hypothetical protein O6H91_02G080200 [Diphasiastrum complanatum]